MTTCPSCGHEYEDSGRRDPQVTVGTVRQHGGCNFCTEGKREKVLVFSRARGPDVGGGSLEVRICADCLAHLTKEGKRLLR